MTCVHVRACMLNGFDEYIKGSLWFWFMVEGKCRHVIGIDDDDDDPTPTVIHTHCFCSLEKRSLELTLQDNKTMMKDHKNEARQISIVEGTNERERMKKEK